MAAFTHPSLTNSQLSTLPSRVGPHQGVLSGLVATFRLWRRRIEQKRTLARLTDRELADFGASRSDVYRQLATPFWRAPPPC